MAFKKILTRTVSGAILVAVLIAAILVSEWTFLGLGIIVSSLGLKEFHHITHAYRRIEVRSAVAIAANLLLQVGAFFYAFSEDLCEALECKQPQNALVFFAPYVLMVVGVLVSELFRHRERPLHNLAYFVLGQVFVALPFATLYGILGWHNDWHPLLLLAIFIIIWTNDTFAYLVGSATGRHHLLKHISPHKSWEGFVGGAAFALLAGYLLNYFNFAHEAGLNLWKWLVFAGLVVVFGTLGDLMESLLKRAVGKKDSGNIIPGHGGILDRFDSLLLAGPIIYIYLMFL